MQLQIDSILGKKEEAEVLYLLNARGMHYRGRAKRNRRRMSALNAPNQRCWEHLMEAQKKGRKEALFTRKAKMLRQARMSSVGIWVIAKDHPTYTEALEKVVIKMLRPTGNILGAGNLGGHKIRNSFS